MLSFEKINKKAIIPVRQNKHDAGLDLATYYDIDVAPHQWVKINLGIRTAVPPGYYARIAPRSGNAVRYAIDVLGGVIDSGYRGEIGVILINHSDKIFKIKAGDRIAQLIIQKIAILTPTEATVNLNTDRGVGGFGSTK